MPDPLSLNNIDLSPVPGKAYFNTEREWRFHACAVGRRCCSGTACQPAAPRQDRVIVDATLRADDRQITEGRDASRRSPGA